MFGCFIKGKYRFRIVRVQYKTFDTKDLKITIYYKK